MRLGVFLRDERRVEGCQSVEMLLGHAPRLTAGQKLATAAARECGRYAHSVLWSAERERERAAAEAGSRPPEKRGRRVAVISMTAVIALALIGGTIALVSSSGEARSKPSKPAAVKANVNRFSSANAMRTAKMQVDAGPRPAGSKALRKVEDKLRKTLPNGRFEQVPGHPGLRNIVGSVGGKGPVLVIASHYDALKYPRGSLGANNAAAAVGAVVELARIVDKMDRPADAQGIRFVLFDGEQSPSPKDSDFYAQALRGSRAYVRAHAEEVQALVLLDYVANKNIKLPREGTSDVALWETVRQAAQRVGVGSIFPNSTGASIIDDSTPFQQAGIPTVNFIDWNDPHRHKLSDTYDKLSEASLDAVGETVAQLVIDRDRDPSSTAPSAP